MGWLFLGLIILWWLVHPFLIDNTVWYKDLMNWLGYILIAFIFSFGVFALLAMVGVWR